MHNFTIGLISNSFVSPHLPSQVPRPTSFMNHGRVSAALVHQYLPIVPIRDLDIVLALAVAGFANNFKVDELQPQYFIAWHSPAMETILDISRI